MPVDQVRDVRRDYFHPGKTADSIVRVEDWYFKTYRNQSTPAGTSIQVAGPGRLGGILVRGGAATVQVLAFDAASHGDVVDTNICAPIATPTYDGFVGFPIRVQRGIRITIDQADAIVTVYYKEG